MGFLLKKSYKITLNSRFGILTGIIGHFLNFHSPLHNKKPAKNQKITKKKLIYM